jgi:transposase
LADGGGSVPLSFFLSFLPSSGGFTQDSSLFKYESTREPVRIRADSISYDDSTKTYTAEGKVEVFQADRKLTADKILLNAQTQEVEATGNVRLFCEALKGRCCRVVVVNPHQFQVISRSVKKTDEHDAKVLAEFLSKGLLPEVRMKEEVHARVASLAQTRDKLVKLRTTLKNKVNNLLASRGILIRKERLSSEKGLAEVLASPVSELERMELEILVGEIRHLNSSIKKLEESMKAAADAK